MAKIYRVRTSKDGGLELNEADYKAWKAAGNVEYGEKAAPAAEEAPAESKVVTAPKKAKVDG